MSIILYHEEHAEAVVLLPSSSSHFYEGGGEHVDEHEVNEFLPMRITFGQK